MSLSEPKKKWGVLKYLSTEILSETTKLLGFLKDK